MIDTHAHIDTEAFDDDREEMLRRAKDAGVEAVIIPAIEPSGFDNLIELINKNENLYGAIGIHPHNASGIREEDIKKVESLAAEKKIIAIGEIGLDYYYDFAPEEAQQDLFRKQLKIAKRMELPVIVHNRESDEDLLRIIKEEQDGRLKGVLHCFSSGTETLNKAMELGFHVSFTGNITFKKTDLDDVVREVPEDRFMIETDSPYMTPVPYRGKRNEPAKVSLVAQKIAEVKSLSIEEVISMTSENAKKLFNILALLLFTLLIPLSLQAQDDDYYEDEYYEDEFINPYKKFVGFGPVIGSNTIVETQFLTSGGERSPTYEGLLAYGAAVQWHALDYLILEVCYNYSKNTEVQVNNPGIAPNIHHLLEITSHWIANPESRINLFVSGGITGFFNSINDEPVNRMGINTGLGLMGNIHIDGVGFISPMLELRINFSMGRYDITYVDQNSQGERVFKTREATSFYSIPRFGLMWYPDF
ncbi:MAG: TatD family hydrolase [Candidatus Kapaibacterium sp.]